MSKGGATGTQAAQPTTGAFLNSELQNGTFQGASPLTPMGGPRQNLLSYYGETFGDPTVRSGNIGPQVGLDNRFAFGGQPTNVGPLQPVRGGGKGGKGGAIGQQMAEPWAGKQMGPGAQPWGGNMAPWLGQPAGPYALQGANPWAPAYGNYMSQIQQRQGIGADALRQAFGLLG